MKLQIVGVVLLIGAVNQCLAACQNKQPTSTYNSDLIKGKFYVIAENLNRGLQCVTTEAESPADKIFDYFITYQAKDGSIVNGKTARMNVPPPGTFNGTAGDGPFRQWVVLGGITRKTHVFYSCDPNSGKYLVWVLYYIRVTGIQRMDSTSREAVTTILARNNIPMSELKDLNNNGCKN